MTFSRNNLDGASSPYLRQHADNPVWWQEWNERTLEHARSTGKIVLASVGYSTCHWCHVMAREAFSDAQCAAILNDRFVAIKVDREERPEIDHYLMSYLVATTGSGGWPLNAFLTADGAPFFAMTYASVEARFDTPPFAEILRQVAEYHEANRDRVEPYSLDTRHSAVRGAEFSTAIVEPADAGETESLVRERVSELDAAFDAVHAGFGQAQKFPPHASILFLLHVNDHALDERTAAMARETLDAMMLGGLHDHLQGGFFRYCVDREWKIPHFEKMLYDQAMLLWNFALAARVFDSRSYALTARAIGRCLEETFRTDAFYASGHDADADHREGLTYLWRRNEIERALSESELDAFTRVFPLVEDGRIEGRVHLERSLPPGYENGPGRRLPDPMLVQTAMEKLLRLRRERPQPQRDGKIIVSWNALAGCALVQAYRSLGDVGLLARATELAHALIETFVREDHLAHCAIDGQVQEQEYLADLGSLLLLLSMLTEEAPDSQARFSATIAFLRERLRTLASDGTWWESRPADFPAVPADPFDQPVPSGRSLAEYGLLRTAIAEGRDYASFPFEGAHVGSFANLAALASRGYLHVVESPQVVPWAQLPPTAMQHRGAHTTTCYRGLCSPGLPSR